MAIKIYNIKFQFFHNWRDEFVEEIVWGRSINEAKQKAGVIAQRFGDGWFDVIKITDPVSGSNLTPSEHLEGWR
tara:strand:- start:379 stop:600 length:222 start_codon:yes stop_codon:yes gene_type:complete